MEKLREIKKWRRTNSMAEDRTGTDETLTVKNFSIWNTEVQTLSDEKIIERSKIKVSDIPNRIVKVGKNRIEELPGKYVVDLVIKDTQGNVLDIKKIQVTVKSKKEVFFLFIPLFIFLVFLGIRLLWFMSVLPK